MKSNRKTRIILYSFLGVVAVACGIVLKSRITAYAKVSPTTIVSAEDQKSNDDYINIVSEWIENKNNNCPEIVKRYATRKFVFPKIRTVEKYFKGSKISIEEALKMGVKPDLEKREVVSVEKVTIRNNVFLKVEYHEKGLEHSWGEYEAQLYLLENNVAKYLINGGIFKDAVSFVNLGKNSLDFIEVSTSGGGSGYGECLYMLDSDKKLKEMLAIGTWQCCGRFYEDIDGDGTAEVINTSRIFYPDDLIKILEAEKKDYVLGPFVHSLTIYKWQAGEFKKLGEYYSIKPMEK